MPAAVRVAAATLVAALCGAMALTGCGTAAGPPPGPTVTLKLTGPADDSRVSARSATVTGTVRPAGARVQVLGRRVTVGRHGAFSITIGLSPGSNLIDVEASEARSTGAVAALRVIRFLLVTVPSVRGDSPSQAVTAVRALGLTVKVHGSSDPLNFLIPAHTRICSSSPAAGDRVDPGSTITLKASRFCL